LYIAKNSEMTSFCINATHTTSQNYKNVNPGIYHRANEWFGYFYEKLKLTSKNLLANEGFHEH